MYLSGACETQSLQSNQGAAAVPFRWLAMVKECLRLMLLRCLRQSAFKKGEAIGFSATRVGRTQLVISLVPWTKFCWCDEHAQIQTSRHQARSYDSVASVPACPLVAPSSLYATASLSAGLLSVSTQASNGCQHRQRLLRLDRLLDSTVS